MTDEELARDVAECMKRIEFLLDYGYLSTFDARLHAEVQMERLYRPEDAQ